MSAKIFLLVVALYGPSDSFSHKPHIFAQFGDLKACETAAIHFESTAGRKFTQAVAICVEQKPGVVLGPMI